MEYRILPKSIDESITANEAGDALVKFADHMDGDMNCYFKSVPADTYVNETCKMIAAFIKSNNLTPEDINEIYHAIATSDCVLGSKLWTDEDIKMALDDNFGGIGKILDENAQCEMANNIDEDAFDDCNDHEPVELERADIGDEALLGGNILDGGGNIIRIDIHVDGFDKHCRESRTQYIQCCTDDGLICFEVDTGNSQKSRIGNTEYDSSADRQKNDQNTGCSGGQETHDQSTAEGTDDHDTFQTQVNDT